MTYQVQYEWDGEFWFAHVVGIAGCHTQGRSIGEAERRIREALGLYIDDAESAVLEHTHVLPGPVRTLVKRTKLARNRAEAAQEAASAELARSATALATQSLSVRDIGELLEISHQRVQQILAAKRTKKVASNSRRAAPARHAGRA